ncbi:MAG TPA: cytochrome-c oxidase, cbb3-type subunit III [Aestuariivirga sp.]|nr:cytochrome-c oxidase, cbb3-type subunit III [Hyphomicrobiales bacterium]HQY73416.1 cytochrome-c oxidase, cbb3-type subunit III [Aestuariivirga sp.]
MASREKDEISGIETTGHEWDGIKELNNPLPRWWLWTFYGCIAFALGYMIAYPAWPLVSGATPGLLGYSSRAEFVKEVDSAVSAQAAQREMVKTLPLEEIRNNADLLQFAVAGGRAAFRVNCIQCHGSGAAGGKGYPNLNDDDWLWGGTLEQIHTTLQHGIRYLADPDTRQSPMPAFGADEILTPEQINDVAEHVLSLSAQPFDAAAASRGSTVFAENCVACHGAAGEGLREFGGPRLSDPIALYAADKAAIVAQVTRPRHGVMPAWNTRLDEVTIKQLAIYVHSLGGGEMPVP